MSRQAQEQKNEESESGTERQADTPYMKPIAKKKKTKIDIEED